MYKLLGTQQSQEGGSGRSKKTNESQIFETRTIRGGRGTSLRGGRGSSSNRGARSTSMVGSSSVVGGRMARPTAVMPRQTRSAQHLQQPTGRAASQMLPPRILQKRFFAPITGPGSSLENEVILD